jgi:mRNA-degrading endonuclease RelE of RelBE toxin-antitoxin system
MRCGKARLPVGIQATGKNWMLTMCANGVYSIYMKFIETSVFTKQINGLLPDEQYRELQKKLVFNPAAGDIIKHSGGLRKIRWHSVSKGKRGGIRVIYYWFVSDDQIYMLLAYGKNEKEDLTAAELKILRKLVEGMTQ